MRRNDKTRHEWRKAYKEKEELMIERGYPEVSPHDFYRELFPEGRKADCIRDTGLSKPTVYRWWKEGEAL